MIQAHSAPTVVVRLNGAVNNTDPHHPFVVVNAGGMRLYVDSVTDLREMSSILAELADELLAAKKNAAVARAESHIGSVA